MIELSYSHAERLTHAEERMRVGPDQGCALSVSVQFSVAVDTEPARLAVSLHNMVSSTDDNRVTEPNFRHFILSRTLAVREGKYAG